MNSAGGKKHSFLTVRWNDLLAFVLIHWEITLSEIALFTKRLEVVYGGLAALAPWNDVIHMKNNANVICG